MLVWPMIAIGWIVDMYQRGTASLKRLNEIFVVQPEIDDKDADQSITSLEGSIEIGDLSFRYGENLPWIFNNITTCIANGKTLWWDPRAGKTTLIELLHGV